jgi:outer membrane protein OmpU
MKKQLLTTTALIAAGILAGGGSAYAQANGPAQKGKPVLTIGGWVEGIVGTSTQNHRSNNGGARVGWDSQYDSEFHFNGSVTLDNGIRIRTRAELEGEVSGDQWDEAYMAISGSFGELRIGSMDNAIYEALTPISGTWATNAGQNTALDRGDWITAPSGVPASNIRLNIGDNDSNKINYFTPRVAGFQLALSYLPSFEECTVSGAPNTIGNSQNTECNSSIASTSNNYHNGWSAGFTFDRRFAGIRTALGAGYITAKPAQFKASNISPNADPFGWSVGGLVGWNGFRVSAGYKQERNRGTSDINVLEVGGRYNWSKNWVSLGWINSKSPGSRTVAGDGKSDVLLASYRRDLGPGVQYRFNVFYADFQGEHTGSTDDTRGYAVTTSVRIAF